MATRTSLDNVLGIADPMTSESYVLELGTLPTGTDTRDLTIKCQSAVLPGISNEKVVVTLAGHTNNFRGRVIQTGTMAVTFVEDINAGTLRDLRGWHDYCVDIRTGNSADYKSGYAITSRISMIDTIGNVGIAYNIIGCFPESIDEISLDGTSSTAVLVSCTFSYDSAEIV